MSDMMSRPEIVRVLSDASGIEESDISGDLVDSFITGQNHLRTQLAAAETRASEAEKAVEAWRQSDALGGEG